MLRGHLALVRQFRSCWAVLPGNASAIVALIDVGCLTSIKHLAFGKLNRSGLR